MSASGLPWLSARICSADGRIKRAAHIPQQERAGIAVDQAVHLQLSDVLKLGAGLARGEHDADWLGQQAPGDECQRQRLRLIEPLHVINDTQQRTTLDILGEQGQHPQQTRKRSGGGPGVTPNRVFRA